MKILKKLTALLLLFSMSTVFLASCGGKLNSDDALKISNELIEKSYILNIAVYGKGLDFYDDGNPSTLYAEISDKSPYQTRAQLEGAIDEVFSHSFADAMKEIAFSGQEGIISSTINHARYYSYSDEGYLKVYKYIKGIDVREPDISLTEITKIKSKEIKGVITYKNGDKCEFYMVKEKSVWRLDSPTY